MSGSQGEIRQQIGEILATVRVLDRQQNDTSAKVERAVDVMRTDMAALKHEQRNAQQVTQGSLEIVKIEQQQLKQRLETLEKGVETLRAPVEQWVSLRKRVIGFGLMGLSVMTVIWAIVSPFWTALAQKLFPLIGGK